MYYCIRTDYRHILFYHYCMCILELQPSTRGLLYLHSLQAHTLLSLQYVHPWTTAIHSCINTARASLNYSHPLVYHDWMWILRLQPSNCVSLLYLHRLQAHTLLSLLYVLLYSHRLQARTILSLLYVHTRTKAIHSCIISVCASLNYSHPLLYHYCIHTDYRHILFYHYRMCTLGLQPSTLVSILYMHPRTTTIYSSIITVCAYSDYSHPFLYHDCMCIVIMAIHSCIITVCAYSDYIHPLLYQYCMCILGLQPSNSSVITVRAYLDYSHSFFYHDCMYIVTMAIHSSITIVCV